MQRRWRTGILPALLAGVVCSAAEEHQGFPGPTSTGEINLSLRISATLKAGLLQGDTGAENDLRTLVSSGLVQEFRSTESAILSLCVVSSGQGSFEITAYDLPGQALAFSQFGSPVPLHIGFGKNQLDTVKHRAVAGNCTGNSVLPVTIHLTDEAGMEAGRIHGSLKLLVKSE